MENAIVDHLNQSRENPTWGVTIGAPKSHKRNELVADPDTSQYSYTSKVAAAAGHYGKKWAEMETYAATCEKQLSVTLPDGTKIENAIVTDYHHSQCGRHF